MCPSQRPLLKGSSPCPEVLPHHSGYLPRAHIIRLSVNANQELKRHRSTDPYQASSRVTVAKAAGSRIIQWTGGRCAATAACRIEIKAVSKVDGDGANSSPQPRRLMIPDLLLPSPRPQLYPTAPNGIASWPPSAASVRFADRSVFIITRSDCLVAGYGTAALRQRGVFRLFEWRVLSCWLGMWRGRLHCSSAEYDDCEGTGDSYGADSYRDSFGPHRDASGDSV